MQQPHWMPSVTAADTGCRVLQQLTLDAECYSSWHWMPSVTAPDTGCQVLQQLTLDAECYGSCRKEGAWVQSAITLCVKNLDQIFWRGKSWSSSFCHPNTKRSSACDSGDVLCLNYKLYINCNTPPKGGSKATISCGAIGLTQLFRLREDLWEGRSGFRWHPTWQIPSSVVCYRVAFIPYAWAGL